MELPQIFADAPHRRYNALTGDWVLVSPQRNKRPWQGKVEAVQNSQRKPYEPECYLCPGNKRSDGTNNPAYQKPYSFVNDFSAILPLSEEAKYDKDNLLVAKTEQGICKVICFHPRHDLTLPQLTTAEIVDVIDLWQKEFEELSKVPFIKSIQIFENKGDIMGCSNPHPHGQIWAQESLTVELQKETDRQKEYWTKNGISLLQHYVNIEVKEQKRIVCENEHFVALVPFWATWPYETMLVSKRHITNVLEFTSIEKEALAAILKELTTKYDNLFNCSFPYSAGMHQAPVNDGDHSEWHWHMHFYPPLLRSATVKKFMVGYEMFANPQRDITAETAATTLRGLSTQHYTATV